MLAQVRATLRERALLESTTKVLVACSGGPDSTALLYALHRLRVEHGCALLAVSVDHGLRTSAAADVACAERAAGALNVPFIALSVKVPEGASRQSLARRVRYDALLACAHQHAAQRVAVGHTQDDQAETVLARLLRGTGVPGLAGIAPLREDGVIRPLIDCSRTVVHAYVRELGAPVAHDPSNEDLRYGRVRIRKHLLPSLERENARLVPNLCALADEAREARALIAMECQRVTGEGKPNAVALRAVSPTVRRWVLKAWCERELGTSLLRTHLVALERMLELGGEVRLPGNWVATLDQALDVLLLPNQKRGRGSVRRSEGDKA